MFLMFTICLIALASSCGSAMAVATEDMIEIYPVGSLNLTAYSGRWFQIYASLLPNITFEHNMYW